MQSFLTQLQPIYSVVCNVFEILDALLLIGAIYFFYRAVSIKPRFRGKQSYYERRLALAKDPVVQEQWARIVKKLDMNPPQSYTMAIIEADTFVDSILKRVGILGDTMADRLNQLDADEFATLGRLWRVHRIRNALVHSPGFVISKRDADEAIHVYEAFLRELEVLA
ncbi:MAG: hypothetical protein Q7R98_00620 [Candidatus Jorgensenbacteria bacterium]|nr:hypothetical protein [Candidatus Jorgensenbacteria bacterium]